MIYPTVLTISSGVVCANDPTAINTANDRTAMRRNTQRLEIAVFGFNVSIALLIGENLL